MLDCGFRIADSLDIFFFNDVDSRAHSVASPVSHVPFCGLIDESDIRNPKFAILTIAFAFRRRGDL